MSRMLSLPVSRRAFVAGSAAAAAALALGGCARNASESDPQPEQTPADTAVADSGVAEALTAALPFEGGTCNPVGATSTLFVAAGWHVFEGLYELDLHTYRPELGLAADIPTQVSELEYEVPLRDNLRFSDGSALTVDDICNAFRLYMEDGLYGALLSFIQSVTPKDEQTVRFTLLTPLGSLLRERLSLVRVFPRQQTPEELARKPLGSGPWRYERIDLREGGSISFLPNEYYGGAFPATCKRMTWSLVTDDGKRAETLENKEALCICAAPEAHAEQMTDAGATVEYVPGFNAPFLMFNCKKTPLDDARVRQALLYAIDVDTLIAKTTEGHARACTCLLPDYFRGYHRASTVYSYDPEKARALLVEAIAASAADTKDAGGVADAANTPSVPSASSSPSADAADSSNANTADATGTTHPADAADATTEEGADATPEADADPDKAEAEKEALLSLALRCPNDDLMKVAEAIVADWEEVGIAVEVTALDAEKLFDDISAEPEPADALPFDIVLSTGDPTRFGNDPDLLLNWWYGDNVWTRARSCWSASPQFTTLSELIQKARAATDTDEQQDLWNQCFDLIASDVPLYPLFHRETATAYYESQLDGYNPISAAGLLLLGTTPLKEAAPL